MYKKSRRPRHKFAKVYTIQEIDLNKIDLSKERYHNNNNGMKTKSIPITYNNQPFQIQTPWIRQLFPIQKYKYNENSITRFSLCLRLDDENNDQKIFRQFLQFMDERAMEITSSDDTKENKESEPKYFSAIIKPKNKAFNDHLRLKIGEYRQSRHQNFLRGLRQGKHNLKEYDDFLQTIVLNIKLDLGNGEVIDHPTLEVLQQNCRPNTLLRSIIKVNPIWWNQKNQSGISYRVTCIQIARLDDEFINQS